MCMCWVWNKFLDTLARHLSALLIKVWMNIYESLVAEPVSYTVVINIIRKRLAIAFKPSTPSFICPGDPTPRAFTILYVWDNSNNKYNAVSYLCCSAHPYVFSYILLLFEMKTFLLCNSYIIWLLCDAVIVESCFISFHKKEWNNSQRDTVPDIKYWLAWFEALQCSNVIPSMNTNRLPPQYSDCIWCETLILSDLNNYPGIKHHDVFSDV